MGRVQIFDLMQAKTQNAKMPMDRRAHLQYKPRPQVNKMRSLKKKTVKSKVSNMHEIREFIRYTGSHS